MGDFKFPRDFGFTGSADAAEGRVGVRPHTRQKFAKGGRVKKDLTPKTKLKPSPGQVVGATLAAGAAAAAYKSATGEKGETTPRESKRALQLAKQEKDAGLKRGGFVRRKNC